MARRLMAVAVARGLRALAAVRGLMAVAVAAAVWALPARAQVLEDSLLVGPDTGPQAMTLAAPALGGQRFDGPLRISTGDVGWAVLWLDPPADGQAGATQALGGQLLLILGDQARAVAMAGPAVREGRLTLGLADDDAAQGAAAAPDVLESVSGRPVQVAGPLRELVRLEGQLRQEAGGGLTFEGAYLSPTGSIPLVLFGWGTRAQPPDLAADPGAMLLDRFLVSAPVLGLPDDQTASVVRGLDQWFSLGLPAGFAVTLAPGQGNRSVLVTLDAASEQMALGLTGMRERYRWLMEIGAADAMGTLPLTFTALDRAIGMTLNLGAAGTQTVYEDFPSPATTPGAQPRALMILMAALRARLALDAR